jgi:hypothetical protein
MIEDTLPDDGSTVRRWMGAKPRVEVMRVGVNRLSIRKDEPALLDAARSIHA